MFDDEDERPKVRSLAELRALNLPTANCGGLTVRKAYGDWDEAAELEAVASEEAIRHYFKDFLDGRGCPACGKAQRVEGLFGALLDPCWEWGLAHGEARCTRCGYPARGIHRIKTPSGEITIGSSHSGYIFPYHPNALMEREGDTQ